MNLTGLVVFAVSYALISARRFERLNFDRPAGALLGAVACVVLRVLSPEEALHAVDGATLLLLFGMMGLGAFLSVDGYFANCLPQPWHWCLRWTCTANQSRSRCGKPQ